MVSTRSAKRPRSASEDTDEEGRVETTFTPSADFCFHDGNIIIVAEGKGYLVHTSILARHSAVFKDMLNIPQPVDDSLKKDHPVVHLSDRAEDLERILSMFYDNIKDYDRDSPIPFAYITAMLRLGKKYEIEHLVKEGMKHLRIAFPNKLDSWKPFSDRIVKDKNTIIQAINLAHELALHTMLPTMYLSFLRLNGLAGLLSPTNEHLNGLAVKHMLIGREKLILYSHKQYRSLKQSMYDDSDAVFEDCKASAKCSENHDAAFDSWGLWTSDAGRVTYLKGWVKPTQPLCSSCTRALRAMFDRCREAIWKELPLFFTLAPWEELKDELP